MTSSTPYRFVRGAALESRPSTPYRWERDTPIPSAEPEFKLHAIRASLLTMDEGPGGTEQITDTPDSGLVVGYAKTDGLVYNKDDTGLETLLSAGGVPTAALIPQQEGYCSANGTSVTISADGILALMAPSADNYTGKQVADGTALELDTEGSGSASALVDQVTGGGLASLIGSANPIIVFKFSLEGTLTNLRFFIGLSDVTTGATADDPANLHVGMQFSSSRDSNWQFMVDDGSTQTLIDTGIAIDADVHFLLIEMIGATEIIMTFCDNTYTTLATTTGSPSTYDLPADTTLWLPNVVLQETSAAVRSVRFFFCRATMELI